MTQQPQWTDDAVDAWMAQVTERLEAFLRSRGDREAPVVRFGSPDELAQGFAEAGTPLELSDPQPPCPPEAMLAAVDEVLSRSVRTIHPRFFNQNFAGPDPVAVLGDWLGAALNTTAATYEAAPVFTLMERAATARLIDLAGLPGGSEGLWAPGGSTSNLFAMHLARHRRFPEIKVKGSHAAPPLAVFTSEQAHYSLLKAVALLGLGTEALFKVACDEAGAMHPDALEAAIDAAEAQGRMPLMVNATAGTTVLGAFDPFEAIAEVATRRGLWMHVDGCYGASTLFSERHRGMMAGSERADSICWNLHKMMGVTQQCSALLVRHPGLLQETFAARANYLFQPDKNFAELDSGDKTFQCARRVDVLKLWLTWKLRGDAGFAARIEHVMELAAWLRERIAADDSGRFVIARPPSFVNVCFWWVPQALRPFDPATATAQELETIGRLAPRIKDRMQREGTAMVGFQPLGGLPNFFRMLFINPAVTREDVEAVLALIDRYGREV